MCIVEFQMWAVLMCLFRWVLLFKFSVLCFNSSLNFYVDLHHGAFAFCRLFAEGDKGSPKSSSLTPYEEALEALSSLITRRTRVGDVNMEERFNVLFEYLKVRCL